VLNLFQRKAQVAGTIGLSLGERHFALARVSKDRDQMILNQCLRMDIQSAQQLRQQLPRQIEEMNLQGGRCNALLAQQDYNLYLVEAPAVEEEEMRSAVRWKIKDLIDMPVEDAVIDIFPAPEDAFSGRNKMLYVVAAVKSKVEQVIELCAQANLELASIDIPEMAMRNVTKRFASDENSLGVVSLKTNGSSMNITRDGNLYLARKINTQMGPDVMQSRDWEALRDRLVLEIQRSLDYYESQMGQNPVSKIFMVPRFQDTEELCASLNEVMAVSVSPLEFASRLKSGDNISDELKHSCMFAIGAALRVEDGAGA
jgi:MSHA biogenesis protein MshI